MNVENIRGIISENKEGTNKRRIIVRAVTCPPIQSIVVVTSPTGDQAPPALAAMMIIPAKIHLSFCPVTSLRTMETITIAVVRLSMNAERKNAMILRIQRSFRFLRTLILSVITSNPSCASINSTIVIAPSRKNSMPDIFPSFSNRMTGTRSLLPGRKMKMIHDTTPVSRAIADL